MTMGFVLAARLPWWGSLIVALVLELAAYLAIGDNLFLSATALLATVR